MAPLNPLNNAIFDKFATAVIYAKLYPYIMSDFMGKLDCKLVHAPGNMIVNTVGGPTAQSGTVIHTASQGGSDSVTTGLKAKYKAAMQVGDVLDKVTG
jgi:hypothetical protein